MRFTDAGAPNDESSSVLFVPPPPLIEPARLASAPITNESSAEPPVRLSTFWKATLLASQPAFLPWTV